MGYPTEEDDHFRTCIHEAGHAVVYALTGCYVDCVQVRVLGTTSFVHQTKRGMQSEVSGVVEPFCEVDLSLIYPFDKENACYTPQKERLKLFLQAFGKRSYAEKYRQKMRGYVAGLFAGQMAEQIHMGFTEVGLDVTDGTKDMQQADAFCRLLPYRNEFEHIERATEKLLRIPTNWACVERIAIELKSHLRLEGEDLKNLLPAPIKNWPPSPRARV